MELISIFTSWALAKSQALLSMLGFSSASTVVQAVVLIGVVVFAVAAVIAVGYFGNLAYKKWINPSLEKPELKKPKKSKSKSTPLEKPAPKVEEFKSKSKSKSKSKKSAPVSREQAFINLFGHPILI